MEAENSPKGPGWAFPPQSPAHAGFRENSMNLAPSKGLPTLSLLAFTQSPKLMEGQAISTPLWLRHGLAGTAYVVFISHVLVAL